MSHAEAMRQARVEFFVKQPIMAWAGGAVSGLMLGGAASGINAAQQAQYRGELRETRDKLAKYAETLPEEVRPQAPDDKALTEKALEQYRREIELARLKTAAEALPEAVRPWAPTEPTPEALERQRQRLEEAQYRAQLDYALEADALGELGELWEDEAAFMKKVAEEETNNPSVTADAVPAPFTQGSQSAAADRGAERRKISMEDFANNESPVWNMLDGADTAAQKQITQDTFDQMVTEGKVVKVSGETAQNVEQYYPDLRNMKKKDRTPILKQKMNELKSSLRSFLNDMRGTSYEFEVNGSILEAKLYGVGVNEVIDAVTEQKAKMLYASAEIFRNAQYLYSLPDTDGDPNIYRWNYFLAPVEIGEDTVAVRVAVRDVAKGTDLRPESQIYNWNIKKDAALDGGSRGPKIASPGVSSATSDVANNISQKNSGVNTVYAEDGANIQRPRTLGEEMQRQMMQRGEGLRREQSPRPTAADGGAELRGLSLPTLNDNMTGGMRNGQAETGGTEPAEGGADPSSVAYGDTFPQGGRLAGTESADAGAGGGAAQRGAESTNDKRDGGRIGGGRTAGKAGGVDTRARAAIHGTPERYRARAEVQALAKDLAARGIVTPKSAAELGVQNGTDARTLTVIPEEYWDKTRYGDVLHELRDAGYEVIAVSGRIETEADGVRTASNGTWIRDMYGDETVIIQLDSPKADPYQIAAHERGHSLLARGEGMSRQVWEHLRQKNVQELDRLLERYIRGMRGIADVDGALTAEQRQMVEDAIMEEILCDALGGMERYGERAGAIRGEVREAMTELYGEGAVARENSEAVRRTGEAAERHSIETLPNGDKYVRADRQVIFGNDPEVWREQVENYINGKIRQGEDVQLVAADGDILKLTSDTAGKIASPYKDGRTLSEETYQVKANAGVHIDELARISVGKENKKDAGARHGAFASGGWNYREAFFRDFDGKYYLIKFSVAKNNDGNIVYSIDDIDERAFPTAHDAHHGSSGVAGALGRESSADSITDTQQNVKSAPQPQQSAGSRKPKQKSSYDFIRELTEETERQEQTTREERRRDGRHRSGADTEAAADYVSAMEEIYGELDEAAENLPSSLVNTDKTGRQESFGERVREGWSYFKRKMVDSGEAVSRVAKATGDKSLYAYYNHARASSNAAIYMISDKQTNIRGEVVGKGLNEIFAPIRKDDAYYRDFQLYLLHKHNIDRMSLANPAATEMAREDFRMFKAEHPELENYAEYQIEEAARDEAERSERYADIRNAAESVLRGEKLNKFPVFSCQIMYIYCILFIILDFREVCAHEKQAFFQKAYSADDNHIPVHVRAALCHIPRRAPYIHLLRA